MKYSLLARHVSLFIGIIWALLPLGGYAQHYPFIQLSDSMRTQIMLTGVIHSWRQTGDSSLTAVVDSLQRGSFRPLTTNWLRGTDLDAPYWFYLKIKNEGNTRQLLLVVTEDVQKLTLYQRAGANWTLRYQDGMLTPLSQRTLPNMHFPFPLTVQAGQEIDVLVKAHNPTRFFVVRFELWDSLAYSIQNHTTYFRYGLFGGLILITSLFSLFCLITLRDRVFGYYAGYILGAGVLILGGTGLTAEYLWPAYPRFTLHERAIFISLSAGLHVLFVGAFMERKAKPVRFVRYTNAFALISLLIAGSRMAYFFSGLPLLTPWFVFIGHFLFEFTIVGYLISTVTIVGYQCWLGNRYAWYYVGVHSIFLGVLVTQTLSRLKIIKAGVFLESYSGPILIEIVALAFGLAYRYHDNRRQRLKLEKDLTQTQRELIKVEENERQRIAADLHDDVGNTLAAAKGSLSNISRKLIIKTEFPEVAKAQSLIEKASQDLRSISHNLMPVEFEKYKLSDVVRQAVERASNSAAGIQFEYIQAGTEHVLKPERSLIIYRIVNELINNILKHSGAKKAYIQMIFQPESLVVTVEDNGKGFATINSEDVTAGIGLKNITSRVNYINAQLDITSNQLGTCVIVEVPYA